MCGGKPGQGPGGSWGLRHGRRSYKEALAECGVLKILAPFDPRIAGTPPLGLDLPGSDIDVLCFVPDAHTFVDTVWRAFSSAPGFTAKQLAGLSRPVIVSFEVADWRVELYGAAIPVDRQQGWRHFIVERRLLALGGIDFQAAVLALRRRGMKTEPAFAAALGRREDPYVLLLNLGEQGDEALVSALQAMGFTGSATPYG